MFMRRRTYLQYLTAGTVGFAGCSNSNSNRGTQQGTRKTTSSESTPVDRSPSDSSSETDVTDNSVFLSYDSMEYREIFDYEKIRSRDTLTDSPARNGSALEVPIPEGQHRGMRMRFWMDEHFGSEPEEASATYWLYVPSDFEFANSHSGGGKLPGFQGTYGECGAGDLGPCDGSNGWSARMSFVRPEAAYLNTDFGLAFYVYHGEMAEEPLYPFGTYVLWDQGLEFDRWNRIDQYVKMNTPGDHDGILKGWINGDEALNRDGFLFRNEQKGGIRIQEFVNTVYFGGEWTSPRDNVFYFDDLEIRLGRPDMCQTEQGG